MEVVVLRIQFELNNVAKECFFLWLDHFYLHGGWLVLLGCNFSF